MSLPVPAPESPRYRLPEQVQVYQVCPHCLRPAILLVEGWQCVKDGFITPRNSAVFNAAPYAPDWSAA